MSLIVRLMKFAPHLSASGTTTSVVGSSNVSGVVLREFPPPGIVLAALLAWLAVVVVIHVVALTATKRTNRPIQPLVCGLFSVGWLRWWRLVTHGR
jgi:hypothetical protein